MKSHLVARDEYKDYTVSTIRLDIKGAWPHQWETMIFKKVGRFRGGLGTEVYCTRWQTEETARHGHEVYLKHLKTGWIPENGSNS